MEFEGGIRGFQKIMFLYLALAGVTKGCLRYTSALLPNLVLRAFFEVFNLSEDSGVGVLEAFFEDSILEGGL